MSKKIRPHLALNSSNCFGLDYRSGEIKCEYFYDVLLVMKEVWAYLVADFCYVMAFSY